MPNGIDINPEHRNMKNRKAKVLFSYLPQNEDELKLDVNDIIDVIEEVEEGWWKGKLRGVVGVFPSNFVAELFPSDELNTSSDKEANETDGSQGSSQKKEEIIKPEKKVKGVGFGDIFAGGIKPKLSPIDGPNSRFNLNKKPAPAPVPTSTAGDGDSEVAPRLPPKPVREQARVTFAYQAQNDDELTINEGDIINIISKEIEDQGWWKGELNGVVGVFPDNFVELIKVAGQEDKKKPDRPSEKPPGPMTGMPNPLKASSKLESTKASNKSLDELPKTNSSAAGQGPAVPVKKPKVNTPSIFQKFQSKSESLFSNNNNNNSVKPDVVPVENENVNSFEKDDINNDSSFSTVESSKLTHLTANRAKGPASRRPPSTIFLSNLDNKENGDVEMDHSNDHSPELKKTFSPAQEKNEKIEKTEKPLEKQEKQEKVPQWMLELRKAQAEKREKNTEEISKIEPTKPLGSPTKPNRFSGDFGSKITSATANATETSNQIETSATSILKPVKSTKPNVATTTSIGASSSPSTTTTTTTTITTTTTAIATATTVAPTSTPSQIAKTVNAVGVASTTTSTSITKTNDDLKDTFSETKTNHNKEIIELRKEIALMKESMVTRREYNDLVKQVLN